MPRASRHGRQVHMAGRKAPCSLSRAGRSQACGSGGQPFHGTIRRRPTMSCVGSSPDSGPMFAVLRSGLSQGLHRGDRCELRTAQESVQSTTIETAVWHDVVAVDALTDE